MGVFGRDEVVGYQLELLRVVLLILFKLMQQQIKSKLKLSRIDDHHTHQMSDKLYDPLRNVLLNPQTAIHHEVQSPRAAKSSTLSSSYKRLTRIDAEKIKNDIYIPIERKLLPTDNLNKVKDSRMRIIDAKEKIIGAPIKQEDMHIIKNTEVNKESKIVYQFSDHKEADLTKFTSQLTKFNKTGNNLKSQFISSNESVDNFQPNTFSKITQVKSAGNLKLSTIEQHNQFENTDKLYEPLRAILTQPQIALRNHISSPKAASFTHLKDPYKRLTFKDARHDIMIPSDKQLVPTSNIQKIKDKKFRVVNATQKKMNKTITQKQLSQILANSKDVKQIVYEFSQSHQNNNQNINTFKQSNPFTKIKSEYIFNQPASIAKEQNSSFLAKYEETPKKYILEEHCPPVSPKNSYLQKNDYYQRSAIKLFQSGHAHYTSQNIIKQQPKTNKVQEPNTKQQNYMTQSKASSTYKYNLFSSLDLPYNSCCTNTNCSNQIVAIDGKSGEWNK